MDTSLIERVKYVVKRHVVGILLAIAGLVLMTVLGSALSVENSLDLVFSGFVRVGLGVSAILLVLKFAFPKLNIQGTIANDPKAVAVFCGLIAVAIALLF